jgi:predicted MFS family arabinose efflux permease
MAPAPAEPYAAAGDSTAVWLLALGQTLIYAATYYSFPALLPDLEAATGWDKATLALGPTVAFLIMAVLTPFAGRLVDRGLGGEMLVAGPLLAALGVAGLGLAAVPWQWMLAWALIGVAQAGSLYETCFAFLTRRLGAGARGAITRVTLVAGFAGTLAFPLGRVLGESLGGQGAMLVFAGMAILGVVPVNLLAVHRLRRIERAAALARPADPPGILRQAARRAAFWAIALAFGLANLNHAILITYVLPLFQDRGAGVTLAATAAACIGPAQVAGRLALVAGGARIRTGQAVIASFAAISLAAACLWLAGAALPLIFAFALLQGAGVGLMSILRPVLIAEVLGRQGFGSISGAIAVAPILGSAAGPAAGAMLLSQAGSGGVLGACGGMALAGLGTVIWLARRAERRG